MRLTSTGNADDRYRPNMSTSKATMLHAPVPSGDRQGRISNLNRVIVARLFLHEAGCLRGSRGGGRAVRTSQRRQTSCPAYGCRRAVNAEKFFSKNPLCGMSNYTQSILCTDLSGCKRPQLVIDELWIDLDLQPRRASSATVLKAALAQRELLESFDFTPQCEDIWQSECSHLCVHHVNAQVSVRVTRDHWCRTGIGAMSAGFGDNSLVEAEEREEKIFVDFN